MAVDVTVAGFLRGRPSDGVTKISLWPSDSRITDTYTHSLVYEGTTSFPSTGWRRRSARSP
jgi:hypothetical protein